MKEQSASHQYVLNMSLHFVFADKAPAFKIRVHFTT